MISCAKCGLKHPSMLHIPQKGEETDQAERKSEVAVDNTLVLSVLTGTSDHDCKLSIVPVQLQSRQGSKIVTTYVFVDQGHTENLMHTLGLTGKKAHFL